MSGDSVPEYAITVDKTLIKVSRRPSERLQPRASYRSPGASLWAPTEHRGSTRALLL